MNLTDFPKLRSLQFMMGDFKEFYFYARTQLIKICESHGHLMEQQPDAGLVEEISTNGNLFYHDIFFCKNKDCLADLDLWIDWNRSDIYEICGTALSDKKCKAISE